MRIKVYGKAHLEGVAKKSGNPYNFNQVHYHSPLHPKRKEHG